MNDAPTILRTAIDPHHEPYSNQWGWDGSNLYIRENVPSRRWVRVKRISFTPARVKALAALVSCEGGVSLNPWTEMRENLHDWIEQTKMDLYPDPYGRFYEGYLQALDEVLDYVTEREEQDG